MPKISIQDFHGLYTSGGARARPQGSSLVAKNVNVEAPGLIRSRWGYGKTLNGATSGIVSLAHNPATATTAVAMLAQCYDKSLRSISTTGVATTIDANFCAATPSFSYRMKSALCQKNVYATTDSGVKNVYSDFTTTQWAGQARGQMYRQQNNGAPGNQLVAGTGILAANSARAYRCTLHRFDADQVEISGPPSGRLVITNITGTTGYTGGALDPVPAILLPNQYGTTATALTTSWYYRIWASRTSTGTPDDEMYLLVEKQLTNTDISNGYVVYTDAIADSLLITGAALHTNINNYQPPSPVLVKGVLNEDAQPPSAWDVALWRDCVWYADTWAWRSQTIVMLSNPANNDTITIGGKTLTFKTAAAAAADQVHVEAGYASASSNIEATACNLVDQINLNKATTGVEAQYISGPSAFPGQIFLRSVDYAWSIWLATTTVSAATKWLLGQITQRDPTTMSPVTSRGNQLYFSKPGRADAVPPSNALSVGPSSTTLRRVIPYRDALYIFTDAGLYRVTGNDATSFDVEQMDSTVVLLGRELVGVVDDRIFAWCTQGICSISASGVEWLSTPVRDTLEGIIYGNGLGASNFNECAFCAPQQILNTVVFWYPVAARSTLVNANCLNAIAYNTRTGEFTQHAAGSTGYSCAGVRVVTGFPSPILADTRTTDSSGGATLTTSGMQYPTSGLAGLTLIIDISTNGGSTFPTSKTMTFATDYATVGALSAAMAADITFVGTDLTIADDGVSEFSITSTATGSNVVLRVSASSTSLNTGSAKNIALTSGQLAYGAAAGSIYSLRDPYSLADAAYKDSKQDGTFTNTDCRVGIAIQAPEGVESPHWQEVVVRLAKNGTFNAAASYVTFVFYDAAGNASSPYSVVSSDQPYYRRIAVPQDYRRGPELRVEIRSDPTTNGGPQFFGIECVDVLYGDVAHGTVRK